MKRAIEKLDGTEINGRKIKMTEDKPRRRRRFVLIENLDTVRKRYTLKCVDAMMVFQDGAEKLMTSSTVY